MCVPGKKSNRLILESSPYLLQHAHNPVNWYPWGTAALQKAKEEDKLILVSIGYAACHWCHVMARETFENEATAQILNEHFVAIKVDREERPDLDDHFMAILTTMTGAGGWPLNLFITPDLQPVFGGTYFPPEPRDNRPSFNQVLTSLHQQWSLERESLNKNLSQLQHYLEQTWQTPPTGKASAKARDPREVAVEIWRAHEDEAYGGFGQDHKFPHPLIHSQILRWAATRHDLSLAESTLLTLDTMAAGGVRDQLGGGFHRYSVDRYWQVPHFEIMLYDNALLARLYLEAYRLTGRSRYRFVVHQILDDMLRRFQWNTGCFVSSMDADSEGKEGGYYTWTEGEVNTILGREAAVDFLADFVDPLEGTVDGRSVLRLHSDRATLDVTVERHRQSLSKLLAARAQRSAPAIDDKILTSWNGLMISALAQAGAVLGETSYLSAARHCLADLLSGSFESGKLRHSRRGGILSDVVFLDDYAFLIQALIDLYEADFTLFYLEKARQLVLEMLDRFQTEPNQPLALTPRDQPHDLARRVTLEDGATPAGYSSALVALSRLARFSQDPRFEQEATRRLENLGHYLEQDPSRSPELLWAMDFSPESSLEVVIVGPLNDTTTQQMLTIVRRRWRPGLVLAVIDPAQPVDGQRWPMMDRDMESGKPTAYVCHHQICQLPVFSSKTLENQLDKRQE